MDDTIPTGEGYVTLSETEYKELQGQLARVTAERDQERTRRSTMETRHGEVVADNATPDQPELLGQCGDTNPLEGGFYVFRLPDGSIRVRAITPRGARYEVASFAIPQCRPFADGLSDGSQLVTWSAEDLANVASFGGITVEQLRDSLCHPDPVERLEGYRLLVPYFGTINFDSTAPYNLLTEAEVRAHYPECFTVGNPAGPLAADLAEVRELLRKTLST